MIGVDEGGGLDPAGLLSSHGGENRRRGAVAARLNRGASWLPSNAVVAMELRTRMRSWRSIAVLSSYTTILGIIAIAFLIQQAGPTNQSSQIGIQLFQALAVFQLFLILFVTPASTAGAISGERQRQTWDLLLVTRLSSFGIVWGKLMAGLAFNLLLIIASLPLFSLVFLFGGVSPDDILHTYAIFLATVLLLGTMSLVVSALTRRLAASMIISNIVALVLGIGLTLLSLYLQNWGQQTYNANGAPQTSPLTPVAEIDPFVALASALPDGNGGRFLGNLDRIHHAFVLPIDLDLWAAFVILSVVISCLLIAISAYLVRSGPRWLRAEGA